MGKLRDWLLSDGARPRWCVLQFAVLGSEVIRENIFSFVNACWVQPATHGFLMRRFLNARN